MCLLVHSNIFVEKRDVAILSGHVQFSLSPGMTKRATMSSLPQRSSSNLGNLLVDQAQILESNSYTFEAHAGLL